MRVAAGLAIIAAALWLISASVAEAGFHGPRIHHGHAINAWAGSHRPKLR